MHEAVWRGAVDHQFIWSDRTQNVMKDRSRSGLSRFRSLRELTKRNIEAIAELEAAADATLGRTDRLAARITRFVGSMTFVYLHVAWFGIWIMANGLLPARFRIDPFPYNFLTFITSLEAIFLSTFILISQNHEERLTQRRGHLDLQIDLLSEQENSKMLHMLEEIQRHLGIDHGDPEIEALKETTQPEHLVEQIKDHIEKPPVNVAQ